MSWLFDMVALVGLVLVGYGLYLISEPFAFVGVGLLLFVLAVMAQVRHARTKRGH